MSKEKMTATIPPWMARELVDTDDALVGAGKMVYHSRVFGGVLMEETFEKHWEMAAGTLIFVPLKKFVWRDGPCGWRIDQLLCDGLAERHWKEKE